MSTGDLTVYDNYVPALSAGTWYVTADHRLSAATPVGAPQISASQQFVVSAPQFRLDPAAVLAVSPASESSGSYGTVLPHVVLADPMLPWERPMTGTKDRQPWLAVLVFRPNELTGGATDSPTAAIPTTVAGFRTPAAGLIIPAVTPAADVTDTDPCTCIHIPGPVFRAVAPRLSELRYLTHTRATSAADTTLAARPATGGAAADDAGAPLYSVVVANRFPQDAPGAPPARHLAHLVSMEGLEHQLDGTAPPSDTDTVAVISLYSWAFWSHTDADGDFQGLATALAAPPKGGGTPDLLLRLPRPSATGDPVHDEAVSRLGDGYVPLSYLARTGETTVAWYRGPLSAVPWPAPVATFRSADAAIAYDSDYAMFDLSLAAAWQAGRAAALADPAFGQLLLDFRRRAHGFVDALHHRLTSDHFSQTQIDQIDTTTTAQQDFMTVLGAQLLADAGAGPQPVAPPVPPPGGDPPPPDPNPQAALTAFLADPQVQQMMLAAVRSDLDPIATWLAHLLLLEPLPFSCLVADDDLLPLESVRFGYLDPSWQAALLDGALAIGQESSLQVLYASLTGDMIRSAAGLAARDFRARITGTPAPPPVYPVPPDAVAGTGMLLRSALVSGWPNLAVRATDTTGAAVPALRMDRLSPTMLLCLFGGIPAAVEISEPPAGLRFGVDDSGHVPLRNLIAPAAPDGTAFGAVLPRTAPVALLDPAGKDPLALRSLASGVLNVDPQLPGSLVARLTGAVAAAQPTIGALTPGDVAVQMVKVPEAVRFAGPGAQQEEIRQETSHG
jgi:hypothetical protein